METSGLSAAQPLLVLVIGIPGSGKTFFARQFSDSYKFFCLDSGKFESELQDLNSSYEDVSKVSNKLVENTYDQALKAFRHIILTGSYNNVKQRNEVITKAQKSGYRTLIVWVQTDEETAKFRATNRDKRRLDDRGSVQLTEDEFTEQSKNFKKPDLKNESFVVISGKHDFKSQSVIVLKKIASMYMNNLNNNSSSSSSISSTRTVLR